MGASVCDHSGVCDPDVCFREKMRHMRARGGPFVTPRMREGVNWFRTTYREQQDHMVREAAENGNAVRLRNPRYDK